MAFRMNIHGCQLHLKIAIYVVKQLKNDSFRQGLYVITCNNLTDFIDHDFISGEGSHVSGGSEDRAPAAMARAVTIHANAREVMYFA